MMKFYLIPAALSAVLAGSSAAAITLDFDALRNAQDTSVTYVQGPYSEKGYTLTASQCQRSLDIPNMGCFIGVAPYKSMDNTGTSLATQYVSPTVTLSRDDGSAFRLTSIDFSEYFDNGIYQPFSVDVNFSFAFADGTSGSERRTFSTDGKYHPTTFSFHLAPVNSVRWTPVTGSGVQFDNIVLNVVTAAVPEPASWALMIGGFGLMGGGLRRRMRLVIA